MGGLTRQTKHLPGCGSFCLVRRVVICASFSLCPQREGFSVQNLFALETRRFSAPKRKNVGKRRRIAVSRKRRQCALPATPPWRNVTNWSERGALDGNVSVGRVREDSPVGDLSGLHAGGTGAASRRCGCDGLALGARYGAAAAAALPFVEEGGASLGLPPTDVARSSAGETGAGGRAPAATACVGSVRLSAEEMRMTWAKVA